MTRFAFAEFCLDTLTSELTRNGEPVKAEPQTISILEILVENAGQVVSKEELTEKVWAGRMIARSVLDNRIRSVRQLLGDTGKDQTFVKTYPNLGYKFVVAVDEVHGPQESSVPARHSQLSADGRPNSFSALEAAFVKHGRRISVAALGAFTLAIGAYVVSSIYSSSTPTFASVQPLEPNGTAVLDQAAPSIQIAEMETVGDVSPDRHAAAKAMLLQTGTLFSAIEGLHLSVDDNGAGSATADAYTLAATMTETEDEASLTVKLIEPLTGEVAWSKQYDFSSNPTSTQSEAAAKVSRNIAINTANKMGVSTSVVHQDRADFSLAQDYHDAMRTMRSLDATSIDLAREILNAMILEEPDYLPAHAAMYDTHYIELNYSDKPFDAILAEMTKVAERMNVIAPDAPETLTVNALQVDFDLTRLAHPSDDPFDLLKKAAQKGPHYFRAHEELAYMYSIQGQVDQSLAHYDLALEAFPNCPILLGEKSGAQMCGGHELQALGTANLNFRSHPDHLVAKNSMIRFAMNTGDYDIIRERLPGHTIGGQIGYQEHMLAMNWSFMVGDYETAALYALDPQERAYAKALSGNADEVRELVEQMPGFFLSAQAMRVLGDDSLYHELLETEFEQSAGLHIPGHRLSVCQIYKAVSIASVAEDKFPEAYSVIYTNLNRYFSEHTLESFQHIDQYAALAAFYAIAGDTRQVANVLSAANEKGLVFLHRFKDPVFNSALDDDVVLSQLNEMRTNAERLRGQVVLTP